MNISSISAGPNCYSSIAWNLTGTRFTMILSAFMVAFYNGSFFSAVYHSVGGLSYPGIFFILNLALLMWLLNVLVLNLLVIPYVAKPLFIVLLFVAAGTTYFMSAYGIVIHKNMIQNTFETDIHEVRSLLNGSFLVYLIFLGLLPSILLLKYRIEYKNLWQEIWIKAKTTGLVLIVTSVLILSSSSEYASFFRNHKNIRQMANPLNFIYAGLSYAAASEKPVIVKQIGTDAHLNKRGLSQSKPTLMIVVVGEAARADHFAINGYQRNTTPLIAKENIINYSDVTSCGTETAISVPCMFSLLTRSEYSDTKAKEQESVLDVIYHAGIPVLWRDNNSSCKGACDRVTYEDMRELKIPVLCNEEECFDNVLLHQLDEKIALMPFQGQGHKMIVLHQKGSHGPNYYQRYPVQHEVYFPTCNTNQLHDCSREEVINAYDNTIHYTDQFLAKTIEWLKQHESIYQTALVYLSDHGESLGENGIYLHGMPYMIAPDEQKHVPFFFWFSTGFEQDNRINHQCLVDASAQKYSQDNLFHTLLGLMNVETEVYRPDLDMVRGCR